MIAIDNISFGFGGRRIYEEASLHIKPGDRIGLIGRNGTGKSTLLRIIVGEYQLDEGAVSMPNDATIGFLNQDLLSFESEKPIIDVAMEGFEETIKLQNQIDKLLELLEHDPSEKNITSLTQKQEQFEKKGGYEMESKAASSLEQLGFTTAQLSMPLSKFSGGWRMRVILAKMLLQEPTLLMLDEPTNHLDLPTIEWLETYLVSYPGSLIIVSHDRDFLNNSVNKVVESKGGKLNSYSGNIDFYEEEKTMREEIQQNAFENQQQLIKQTEQFINRFRAQATKAKQVQSRVKQLDKLERLTAVENDDAVMNIHFQPKVTSGKEVAKLTDFNKTYGDQVIFQDSNLDLLRGEKVAIVGANGKGKSTLLRMIDGSEEFEGERKLGHNVEMAFYAQHQLESLNLNNSIFEELRQSGAERTDLEIRTLLGSFLFSGEEIEKPIKVLSGGEKARVALAKVLVSDSNFLLLDEPTNHLDALSVDMLIKAINNFKGTVLMVSHSRHFIRNTANKIWYIKDHELKEYPGDWAEYDWWRKQQAEEPAQMASTVAKPKVKKVEKKPVLQEEDKKKQKRIAVLENKIMELEAAIEKSELQMAKAINDTTLDYEAINQKYISLKSELEEVTTEWEALV